MLSIATRRLIFALAAIVLPAAFIAAAPPDAPVVQGRPSLAGQFLIATPSMRDPRFDHAVILMVRHTPDGAFGLVINRPVGERSLATLLEALGEKNTGAEGNIPIFMGGPVQLDAAFLVHTTDYHRPETVTVDKNVAVTSTAKVLRDIADKTGPAKSLLVFGYAGWAPGQLEAEMSHNVWYTAPEDPAIVFDEDRAKVWERASAHRTQDL
jgi:putative transcriptional regulator